VRTHADHGWKRGKMTDEIERRLEGGGEGDVADRALTSQGTNRCSLPA